MRAPSFSGYSTFYHDGSIVKQKLKTTYVHPSTHMKYKITVSYKHNDFVPSAIENQLLHSPEYADWDTKKPALAALYSPVLRRATDPLWPTVSGLELFTTEQGNLQWRMFEDVDEVIQPIPVVEIPQEIMRVNAADIMDEDNLMGNVYRIELNGTTYAMKAHESAIQNDLFPTEVKALLKLRNVRHIVQLAGVIVEESPIDGKAYVRAILLRYCEKGDLKNLLEDANPPVDLSRKYRWAAQIAHGIMEIHAAGLMHGDLKCSNVVIDHSDNAFLIDVANGEGFTEGWSSIWDERKDPRRDIYSLGVAIWELIRDGADPIGEVLPLPLSQDASDDIKCIIGECVVDNVRQRPSLADVHAALGGYQRCGCV
jgi:tRNA A-37 threonylcarbamoyl transferase component Bud32